VFDKKEKLKTSLAAAGIKIENENVRIIDAVAFFEALAAKRIPTNKSLWEKIQKLVRGDISFLIHDGERINGPNDGKGFKIHPSAYSNAYAAKLYKKLGGKWKVKANIENLQKSMSDLRKWFKEEDWVAISPVSRTIIKKGKKKKIKPGQILGPCAQSGTPEWKKLTNNGKDPIKCMPRKKAHEMGPKERAKSAQRKLRKEKKSPDTGKPIRSKT
jgi:hypothetical protein